MPLRITSFKMWEKLTDFVDCLTCLACISCNFLNRSSSSITVTLIFINYSLSSLNSWFLQSHPGSLIFLDAQLQFLQQPYFISRQIADSFFYTVGIFSELRITQSDIFLNSHPSQKIISNLLKELCVLSILL